MAAEHDRGDRPYWSDERELTTLHLGHAERRVHLRSHIALERYHGRRSEALFSVYQQAGERTYVQSRLYLPALASSGREHRLADAQAWLYGAEEPPTIVFWELVPASPTWQQDGRDPREDLLLRRLWLAYEAFLLERLPIARRLMTTWEDAYPRAEWAGFLRTIGYAQTAPEVFSKPVPTRS